MDKAEQTTPGGKVGIQTGEPPEAPVSAAPAAMAPNDIDLPKTLTGVLNQKITAGGTSSTPPDLTTPANLAAWCRRRAPLVAVLAAGIGVTAGSLWIAGMTRAVMSVEPTAANEMRALKDAVARLSADVMVLKASTDNSTQSAGAQFAHLADRLDRVEHAQAEPAAKLAKMTETLERLERRTSEVTGALRERPLTTLIEAAKPPPVVPGWVLRRVYDGFALLQGRVGLIEVAVGDPLPGGGRVEAIKRENGRWIVVTSKGLITAQR